MAKFCERKGLPLFCGCAANAYHKIWGFCNNSQRDEDFLEFVFSNKVEIYTYNVWNISISVTSTREEVLDTTRGNILMNARSVSD